MRAVFSEAYNREPDVCAYAPGKAKPIGDHTDYKGGYALPCALNLGIGGAARSV